MEIKRGSIYHKIQVDFAYNSNHIEGSQLSYEQTQYIYDTKTVDIEPVRVDDIIETVDHFRYFDSIIENLNQPLSEELIKSLHQILKTGTYSSYLPEAVTGDYKKYPNYVGNMKTVSPQQVINHIYALLNAYNAIENIELDDILNFHAEFENIIHF